MQTVVYRVLMGDGKVNGEREQNGATGNVVVMPGTRWQIPLVKKLKKRGYHVVVFDFYENQPAYSYADEYRLVDILNKEKCLELAKPLSPVAVVSDECDIAVPTVAWVSEKLSKPTIGMHLAELYTNKFLMREFASKHGFPTPRFYKCHTSEEAISFYEKFNKKMIIKPLNANSSRGVYSINNKNDIRIHFDETMKYSKGEHSILLEEYIDGEEFSVDGMKIGDSYYSLAVAHKIHYKENENLDQSLIFSYDDEKYDYDKLREINEKYVALSNAEFMLTHAEYKFHNGEYYLIEIGARGGGNLLSSVIDPNLSGIDSQSYYLDWATGNMDSCEQPRFSANHKSKCACLDFFDVDDKSGIIKNISGVDMLENDTRILAYDFFFRVGDRVEKARDATSRFGFYIGCCNSMKELQELKEKVTASVSFEFEGEKIYGIA